VTGARTRRTRAGALAALVAGGVIAVLVAAEVMPADPPTRPATRTALPPPVRPAFVPGAPRPLRESRHATYWAPVRRATTARAAPGARAAAVARIERRTPEGTDNAVAIAGRGRDGAGRPWVRIRLAVLPNGTTGWVPRSALGGYVEVRTRLVVDRRRLRLTLLREGRPVFRAPIGVGSPGWDTPAGTFYVRNRLSRYRSPTYGPVAFGLSARSPRATDWPAGGFVGIHGTDRPDLLPGRVSHGCIRLRNRDVLELARRMPVGTLVQIR
jgi:lipoprotein-anchoring transpeptidase ErfK/SrfK